MYNVASRNLLIQMTPRRRCVRLSTCPAHHHEPSSGRFGQGFARRMKAARHKPGRTRKLDEMFVALRDERYLPWRAVDEHGAELDIVLQMRRHTAAARGLLKRVLRPNPLPRKLVTVQLHNFPAAKAEIPKLANVTHLFVKAAARTNNCAEKQPPTDA